MDPLSLLAEEERGPSHVSTLKSDSLEDFEHVLDNTAAKASDVTKFINFEKGQFETDGGVKESTEKLVDTGAKLVDVGGESNAGDPFGSSKNFMQYEQSGEKPSELEDFLMGGSKKVQEEIQDDSDQSQGEDDDSIVSPPPAKVATPEPAPVPIKAATPEPVKPKTPEPIKAPTPEPVKAPTPEPLKPKTPEPVKAPTPVRVPTPEPIKPPTPEPVKAPSPVKEIPKVPAHKYESDEDTAVPPPAPVPRDYPEIGVMEPKDIMTACGLVEALVYWRDPKQSGIVFGSVLVALLSLTVCSLISVVAYSSLIVLTAAVSFRIYKSVLQAVQKTNEGHPFKDYLEVDLTLSPERIREVTDTAVTQINGAITELRRRFLVEDIVDSVKFGLLLYVLTYLGSWFNGLTLIILGFVALFTLPKVYENNQQQIDANLDVVRAKINEVTDKIKAIIPTGKKEEAKDKSE